MPESLTRSSRPEESARDALIWWCPRVFAVTGWAWTLWPYSPLLALIAATALAALLFVLRAPHDLPDLPARTSLRAVLAGDLLTVTAAVTAVWGAWSPFPSLLVLIACVVVLAALSLRLQVWSDLRSAPSGPATHRITAPTALLTALVLIAGQIGVLTSDPVRDALACTTYRPKGDPEPWDTAEPAASTPTAEVFPGEPVWRLETEGGTRVVGGSPQVVTLADPEGFTALSATDGRALWRVDVADLRRLRSDAGPGGYETDDVHHVDGTVLVAFPRALVAFDEATGAPVWCAEGPSQVVPAPPHRFLGLIDSDRARWGLFDLADGSLVAELPDRPASARILPQEEDEEAEVQVGDGRAAVWRGSSLSVYGLDDGELLFHLGDARPRANEDREEPYHRSIRAVRTVGGVTVVSFEPMMSYYAREPERPGDTTDNNGVLAAYDEDGTELWNSAGSGRIETGGPVVGTSIGSCPSGLGDVFLTERTVARGEEHTYAVRAEDGTVVWSSSSEDAVPWWSTEEDEGEPYFSCPTKGAVIDGRLYRPDGGSADAEGYLWTQRLRGVERLGLVGDGLLVVDLDGFTFHTLAEDADRTAG
ncbi:PQQ-binding-like beta-propeller repeat protein [Nocardiopsis sp. Huas11]|uniref:outer membrane protein assembly factor BamB family protein n=1 Tax=Nocardiopsis sp. Huas11 TaxID=2183912 RepID=UPI0013151240|nr:PQQ-binding-like beta-propeller repeat protein [Nocardiopsis sp. Huas11]